MPISHWSAGIMEQWCDRTMLPFFKACNKTLQLPRIASLFAANLNIPSLQFASNYSVLGKSI
jgi:hypothetical protein